MLSLPSSRTQTVKTGDMKKRTIWIIATIMGLSFLALLFLQLQYIKEMVEMKKEQFDESVNRAL